MSPERILFVDTETGGLEPSYHSLLSVGLVVWEKFEAIDQLEILINDGNLKVTEEAVSINQINLKEHLNYAINPTEAIRQIDEFLNKNFGISEKITIAGHNINFDINFLRFFLNSYNYKFHKRFSHRYIDTASILYFLYLSGQINKKVISSDEAFEYFKIPIKARHSALSDAISTAQLFNALLRLNMCSLKNL